MGPNSATKLTHLTFCHLWWVQEKLKKLINYVIWLVNLNVNDLNLENKLNL